MTDPLRSVVDRIYPELFDAYRHWHCHPELSGREVETARTLAEHLAAAGAEVTPGVGGQGVVGVLRNGEGPTTLLRADMDALPVTERTGLDYASTVTSVTDDGEPCGVMHACGHDVHMTTLVGAARTLAGLRDRWRGTLILAGQPAEECGCGAPDMLSAGLYDRWPRPDFALALHVAPGMPAGMVGTREGHIMAGAEFVDVTIRGRGGHGARPHQTIDPVVIAARTITAWQSIVSREIDPLEAVVVTVGSIHGGMRHNIIPDEVKLKLTARTFTETVRLQTLAALRRIAEGVALTAGCGPELMPLIETWSTLPPVTNDPALTRRARAAWRRVLGDSAVIELGPFTGSDDFAFFAGDGPRVPLCYFFVGTVDMAEFSRAVSAGETMPELHNARFAPAPEPTIKTAVTAMAAAALDLMAAG